MEVIKGKYQSPVISVKHVNTETFIAASLFIDANQEKAFSLDVNSSNTVMSLDLGHSIDPGYIGDSGTEGFTTIWEE